MTMTSRSRVDIQPQILVAVYDDGLLITIDGRSVFRHMTTKQMLYMAQDLIQRTTKGIREDSYDKREK